MRKVKLVVLSMSTLLLLAACGENTDTTLTPIEPETEESVETDESNTNTPVETDEDTGVGSVEEPAQTTKGIQDLDFEVSLDDAVQRFMDTFPEAEGIDKVQFDVDDGRFEYELDGFNAGYEFELTIDAETGDILEQSTDDDDDHEVAIDFGNIISPQEAMSFALEAAGSGYVKEWELETDDGRTYYEIDIEGADNNVDSVDIDAVSGDILEIDS